MKNQQLNLLRNGIAFLFLISLSNKSNAQISAASYTIFNLNTTCPVRVDYKIFDGSTCATLCSETNIFIGPSGSLVIPAGCLNTGVDIELVVTTANGIAVNYGSGTSGGPWTCYNGGAAAIQTDTGPTACFGTYNVQVFFAWANIW